MALSVMRITDLGFSGVQSPFTLSRYRIISVSIWLFFNQLIGDNCSFFRSSRVHCYFLPAGAMVQSTHEPDRKMRGREEEAL